MNSSEQTPPEDETRPVRFKEILIVDQDETWALVMRDAVAGGGFRVSLATSIDEAIRKIRDESPDLLLISCLVDAEGSDALLPELDHLQKPPPVVLVGLREGDTTWEGWKARSNVSVVRQPFKSRDVLEVAVALLGSTWEDLTGSAG
jgi:DNA-binding response OmpR family regulator